MSKNTKKAMFVCLGNICRSPIAEAVFMDTVKKAGVESEWTIDSAAIGSWHVGNEPDSRALNTMGKHNLLYNNTAQQIETKHFNEFDYIFGMDNENIKSLKCKAPKNSKAKILLLGDFDPEGVKIIRDPYYDSDSLGFEKCYTQCVRCCTAFLSKVQSNEI